MAHWTARTRFRIEAIAAFFTGALAVVTVVVPDWIEVLTGADPDHGDGSLELVIVVSCGVACVISSVLAWINFRHAHAG